MGEGDPVHEVASEEEGEEALMLVPITEQVFIPLHRIERISFFGTNAVVKFTDSRDTEKIENEDAQRLRMFVDAVVRNATKAADEPAVETKRSRR